MNEADTRLDGATSKDERQYGSPAILPPRLLLNGDKEEQSPEQTEQPSASAILGGSPRVKLGYGQDQDAPHEPQCGGGIAQPFASCPVPESDSDPARDEHPGHWVSRELKAKTPVVGKSEMGRD